jgi:hypothetical protein
MEYQKCCRLTALLIATCGVLAAFDADAAALSGHVQSKSEQLPVAGIRIEIKQLSTVINWAVPIHLFGASEEVKVGASARFRGKTLAPLSLNYWTSQRSR